MIVANVFIIASVKYIYFNKRPRRCSSYSQLNLAAIADGCTDLQTILLLESAFLCVFRFFGLSSFDIVTTLILSCLASFLPFFEVIPEIFCNFAIKGY
ncbi:hypothetical protein IMSAGC016_01674 [Muribaculaceae bacterium]|nr:hypothetical protein IMSAGC016_01674 [Muribaculaceae bacterium]